MIPHEPGTWMNRGPWCKRGYSRVSPFSGKCPSPGDLEDDLRSDEGGGSIREFTGFPVSTATSISRGAAVDRRFGGRPASVPHISAAFGSPARGGGCRFAAPRNVLADQL